MTDVGDLVHHLRNTTFEILFEQSSGTVFHSSARLRRARAFTHTQTADLPSFITMPAATHSPAKLFEA